MRDFYIETYAGREIGTFQGRTHQDALKLARANKPPPSCGWDQCRVFAQLDAATLSKLARARDAVNERLKADPRLRCPEGAAKEAAAAAAFDQHAMASAWFAAAAGLSIGHNRTARYEEQELKHTRSLDPGYEPWNNITPQRWS